MKMRHRIVMSLAAASLAALTGCVTPPETAAKNAAGDAAAPLANYVPGNPIPAFPSDAITKNQDDSYSAAEKARIEREAKEAYARARAKLIQDWIDRENKRISDEVAALLAAAEKDVATNGLAQAHMNFEKAREILWQSCVTAKINGDLVAEVNGPVRDASIKLMNTKVNTIHWPIISREMRDIADVLTATGKFDEAVEALKSYPYIRTYTRVLDERLDAVTAELVRLHVPAVHLKPLAEKARRAMTMAANLKDEVDEVAQNSDNKAQADSTDPLKRYKELLKEYHDALIMYGCTPVNADKITDYLEKNVQELIADLRKKPTHGKDFLENITNLGATAINKRIDATRKELLDLIEAKRAEREKVLAQVKEFIAKADLRGAQEFVAKELISIDKNSPEMKLKLQVLLNYLTMEVNPALWAKIEKEINTKVDEFVKAGKASEGVAWLQKYPYVRTYAEEIDKSYAEVKAETIALGVPEAVATRIIDEIAAETAGLDNLADFTDKRVNVVVKPGKKLGPKDLVDFEKKLVATRKVLVENDCTEENADKVVKKFQDMFDPEFGRIGEEVRENVLVLGACAINKRLKALKQLRLGTLIAQCAAAKTEAGDFTAARAVIRDIALTGDAEFDALTYTYRIGVLNSIVNPLQLVDELKKIDAKVKELLDAGKYREFREWATNYSGVHDEYADIASAIEAIRKAAVGIKVEEEDAQKYAEKLAARLQEFLEKRKGSYQGPENQPDLTEVQKGVDALAKAVLEQYYKRSYATELAIEIPKEVLALLRKNQPATITTWELNQRLQARVKELLVVQKEIDKQIARQEYLELLAKMNSDFNYDSQIAMAEDAISKQLGINCPEAYLKANAVLGDYARAMRLLKLKAKLTPDQLVAVTLGAVYLDQPSVFDHARELKADVNGVSMRDPLKRTALLFAIQLGRTAFVHRLVSAGANVEAVDAEGNTTVHYAARRGNLAVLDAMLKKNDVNVKNKKGRTALFFASSFNQEAVVSALIAAKIDVTIKDAGGLTAMDVACMSGSRDVLDALAKAGAEYGPDQLALAADADRLAVAEWLVTHGVDVNAEPVVKAALCGSDTKRYLIHEGLVVPSPCQCRACKGITAAGAKQKPKAK